MSSTLLLMQAAIPSGTRVVLMCLVGLLLLILAVLTAFAVVVRKRGPTPVVATPEAATAMREALSDEPSIARELGAGAGHALVESAVSHVASKEPVICPSCTQQYESSLRFCPADARALMPLRELRSMPRRGSQICPHCSRGFEASVESCPHDGCELVPQALYEATRGRLPPLLPSGVVGRICPHCRRRYDLVAKFCPHDGVKLSSLN